VADLPKGFRFRWERAFLATDVTKTQRVVGLVLATHMNKTSGEAHPSLATIARLSGCKPMTVHHAVEAIEAAGFLVVKRRGRSPGRSHVNTYVFEIPGYDPDECTHENWSQLGDVQICAACRLERPINK
jgi:hypothetical protein